jgi:N-acetylmuramoyl-L-alanine amidase
LLPSFAIPSSGAHSEIVNVDLLPVEIVEATPLLQDEAGNDIPNSDRPRSIPEVNDLVEEPRAGQIPNVAYRILKARVPEMMAGQPVRWSMTPQFTPEGEAQPRFRGQWPAAHPDRFEASDGQTNYYQFNRESQEEGTTIIDADGETAVRINLPPIGFNKARVRMEFENYPGAFVEIDFEVPAVVVIDPGHGGNANLPGSSFNNATSPSGVLEKNIALSYGLGLRDSLRARAQQDRLNLKVFMTRVVDENVAGSARAAVARDRGADVIFIIHFNASTNHTARGTLAVRRVAGNVNQDEDMAFINEVIGRIVPAMQAFDPAANIRAPVDNDTSVASDANLGNAAAYHPIRAGYCEVEFLDNAAADALLNTGPNAAAVRTAVVNAMRDGIIRDLRRQPAAP